MPREGVEPSYLKTTWFEHAAFTVSPPGQVGDVLIWDERAMLHRGQPWPYSEPRTLMSICCSATQSDGLTQVKVI